MKISSIAAFRPVKNALPHSNVSAPVFSNAAGAASKNISNDTFVKSEPSFGEKIPVVIRRPEVIEAGKKGIIGNFAIYARSFAYAWGDWTPVDIALDECMDEYFNLCCAAASTYELQDGKTHYPSCQEFLDLIEDIWTESTELAAKGRNFDDDKIRRLPEAERMPYLEKDMKRRMAGAMDTYAQRKYDMRVTDADEAREFAYKVYNDKSTRTIKPKVSQSVQRERSESRYFKMLNKEFDSDKILTYLQEHKNVFFGPPSSIRQRFDMFGIKTLGKYKIDNMEEPKPVREWDEPSDTRTDWERWYDEHGL